MIVKVFYLFILAVSQVAKKFSGIIPADKISKVEEEYEEFQITPEADLPKYIKNEG